MVRVRVRVMVRPFDHLFSSGWIVLYDVITTYILIQSHFGATVTFSSFSSKCFILHHHCCIRLTGCIDWSAVATNKIACCKDVFQLYNWGFG